MQMDITRSLIKHFCQKRAGRNEVAAVLIQEWWKIARQTGVHAELHNRFIWMLAYPERNARFREILDMVLNMTFALDGQRQEEGYDPMLGIAAEIARFIQTSVQPSPEACIQHAQEACRLFIEL